MEYKLNLTSTENKDLISYCNLNDLRISEIFGDGVDIKVPFIGGAEQEPSDALEIKN